MIKRFLQIFILLTLIQSCGSEEKKTTKIIPVKKEKIVKEFALLWARLWALERLNPLQRLRRLNLLLQAFLKPRSRDRGLTA